MSVKMVLADELRALGYDYLTALSIADKRIKEFERSGKKEDTIICGPHRFIIKHKER